MKVCGVLYCLICLPYLGRVRMDSWRVRIGTVCEPCRKRKIIGGKNKVLGAGETQ